MRASERRAKSISRERCSQKRDNVILAGMVNERNDLPTQRCLSLQLFMGLVSQRLSSLCFKINYLVMSCLRSLCRNLSCHGEELQVEHILAFAIKQEVDLLVSGSPLLGVGRQADVSLKERAAGPG